MKGPKIPSCHEWVQLNENEQRQVIWDYGVCIGERKSGLQRWKLYQVGMFFIEAELAPGLQQIMAMEATPVYQSRLFIEYI